MLPSWDQVVRSASKQSASSASMRTLTVPAYKGAASNSVALASMIVASCSSVLPPTCRRPSRIRTASVGSTRQAVRPDSILSQGRSGRCSSSPVVISAPQRNLCCPVIGLCTRPITLTQGAVLEVRATELARPPGPHQAQCFRTVDRLPKQSAVLGVLPLRQPSSPAFAGASRTWPSRVRAWLGFAGYVSPLHLRSA